MSLLDVYVALRARWRTLAVVAALVLAAAVAATFLRTPKYTARASIVLDVKSPDPIAGVVLPGLATNAYMATQINVLLSERVALRAIRALGLDEDESRRQDWREATEGVGSFESWLAAGMLNWIDALPAGRDSNVLNVQYTSPNAGFAAAVVNAWVKAYIDTTLDLRVEPAKQYNDFFAAGSKQLRDELEAAQTRLSVYQREKGLVASDERLDVENQRLAELSSQLVQLQAVVNESGSRQRQSAQNAARMPEVFNSPVIVSMSTELSRTQAQANELAAKLGENHPTMVELRARIRQLQGNINAETSRVASGLAITDDINRTRLAQTQRAAEEQRAKLLQLKGFRDEAAVLLRDVENARRAYDTMLARASQTAIESQTTQTNVSVLQEASTPVDPSSPNKRLNLLVGVFVGVLLGAFMSVLREMRDRRLRTDADVIRVLGQPLLGVLPAKSRGQRDNALQGRLMLAGSSRPKLLP
jgi:chain length determinant protein EpsF